MSEISRAGKQSGKLQHQFYKVNPSSLNSLWCSSQVFQAADKPNFFLVCFYEGFQESRTWGFASVEQQTGFQNNHHRSCRAGSTRSAVTTSFWAALGCAGMGDFRRTRRCLDSLLQLAKFRPFPSTARKTELVFTYTYFSQLHVPGACVCIQAPASVSTASFYSYGSWRIILH